MNFKFTFISGLISLLITPILLIAGTGRDAWTSISNEKVILTGTRNIQATHFLSYRLDRNNLLSLFNSAPKESAVNSRHINSVVEIPMPDGSFAAFNIIETQVMHPDLAAKYPDIRTFAGQGITDPSATAKFDFTMFGFHAMILSSTGSVYIDPYSMQDPDFYMAYYKKDFITSKSYNCMVDESKMDSQRVTANPPSPNKSVGSDLKTYRLAMACTGEYAAFHGGTVAGALSGIVTSVNRVTGVYEREFSIRMVLIANTDTLIFTNAGSDPYTNNDGGAMLGQNQTTVNARIGGGNYDIGHVFSTGGGGIAGLGVICNLSNKARGVTGLNNPIGDPFDIDYVAHEIGHQFGGNHTFNCEVGACSGNRSFTAAYEPGSGSTIMAYAGICGNNNLQTNSDDYFHTKSFDEIIVYTTTGLGNNCPVVTSTGNTPPVINPLPTYTIPYLTPFRLTADAFDPDGDPLTYCWEQYNLGPAGSWSAPVSNAPIFRSFDPSLSPTRLFPKLANILANNQTIGEVKPSYARTLSFKITARDNRLNGGGVTNNDTPYSVVIINTGQAFEVTSQNNTGVIWTATGVETVTWNVGGSDISPISTPLVNILLSTDGGTTFPITLASGVANNGSYNVNVPNILTTTARVMVEGSGNIFFDINNKNFEIGSVGINENELNNSISIGPNPVKDEIEFIFNDISLLTKGNNVLEIFDVTGRKIFETYLTKTREIINVSEFSSGVYTYRYINSEGKSAAGKIMIL